MGGVENWSSDLMSLIVPEKIYTYGIWTGSRDLLVKFINSTTQQLNINNLPFTHNFDPENIQFLYLTIIKNIQMVHLPQTSIVN